MKGNMLIDPDAKIDKADITTYKVSKVLSQGGDPKVLKVQKLYNTQKVKKKKNIYVQIRKVPVVSTRVTRALTNSV